MATREEDDSYGWWEEFLNARTKAIHAQTRLGRTPEFIAAALNLEDGNHVRRILAAVPPEPYT